MNDLIRIEGVKKTIFGAGSLDQIAEECKVLKGSRALLVIDQGLSKTDICSRVEEVLRKARIRTFLYPEVTPEPAPALADDGADVARKEKGELCHRNRWRQHHGRGQGHCRSGEERGESC